MKRWRLSVGDRLAVMRSLSDPSDMGAGSRSVARLEAAIAEQVDVRHAIAVGSGTTALAASLAGVGVGPGDEVITPAVSFSATPMSALVVGAKPVFADVSRLTGLMHPEDAEGLVTDRTRAILPVALHGLFLDAARWDDFGRRLGIPVVWDHCQSWGAVDAETGVRAGATGAASASSLNVTKGFSSVEGGFVTTDDDDVARAVRLVTSFGEHRVPLTADQERSYWSRYPGYNGRLASPLAALALSRLGRVDADIARGRAAMTQLRAGLRGLPGVTTLAPPHPDAETPWLPRIVLLPAAWGWTGEPAEARDRVVAALRARGLPVGTWQRHPLPAMPAFRRSHARPWHRGMEDRPLAAWEPDRYPGAVSLLDRSLVIGLHPTPIHLQGPREVARYIDGMRWVIDHMDEVLSRPYTSLVLAPPIPDGDL